MSDHQTDIFVVSKTHSEDSSCLVLAVKAFAVMTSNLFSMDSGSWQPFYRCVCLSCSTRVVRQQTSFKTLSLSGAWQH